MNGWPEHVIAVLLKANATVADHIEQGHMSLPTAVFPRSEIAGLMREGPQFLFGEFPELFKLRVEEVG
jgi:hypothetical protein